MTNLVDASPAAATADQRWAAWVAKGVADDRQTRKRIVAVAWGIAAGLASWVAIAMMWR